MKLKIYTSLFQFFSFLSDKTNGTQLFVKYKLLLGTVLIGLTSASCSSKPSSPQISCYDIAVIASDSIEESSKAPDIKTDTVIEPRVIVTCYEMSEPYEPEQKSDKSGE